MSILTMSPSPEWYEAPDLLDDDQDEPDWPSEALHVLADCIVWHCGAELDDN